MVDDNSNGGTDGTSPPRGVFSTLGVMEVEQNWNAQGAALAASASLENEYDGPSSPDDWAIDSDDEEFRDDDIAAGKEWIFDAADGGVFEPSNNTFVEDNTNYKFYETQPTNRETQDIIMSGRHASITATAIQRIQHESRLNKGCTVCTLSLLFAGIIAAVVSTVAKPEELFSSETAEPLETPYYPGDYADAGQPSKPTFYVPGTEAGLSDYGYPYVQHTSSTGWVTWPPDAEDENSYLSFDGSNGIKNLEECAAKCEQVGASTGVWSVKYQACWCSFIDVSLLCREPCVADEYIDFSTVPIDGFDHCKKSVCDQEWYHSSEYCGTKYDKDSCDAKIEALVASSSTEELKYEPSAMTTVKKSSPDANNGGMVHFSVEGSGERVSYVRFELPEFPKEDVVIAKAELILYLVEHNVEPGTNYFDVAVDALPHAGRWKDGTVSWNERPIDDREAFFVETLRVVDFVSHRQVQRVDVTDAIDPTRQKRITFKLYTDELSGRLDFAGEDWNSGENVPELVIVTSSK